MAPVWTNVKVELARFADRLDTKLRERGHKDNPKVLALATGRVKLPFTKMEKRQEEQVSGRISGVLLPAQEVGDSC